MNRYYYSTTGRFTTPDPYIASGGSADPGSWNRYAYVGGDPVSYNDPGGLLIALPDQAFDDWGHPWNSACFQWLNLYGMWSGAPPSAACYGLGGFTPVYIRVSGGGGGGGGSGAGTPYYRRFPCDRRDPTNAKIFSFMDAHRGDAEKLGTKADVPWQWILGVSAEETLYGTEGIITKGTYNFFGLHVNGASDTSHYLNQVSVYKTEKDGYVATFAQKTGFLDSGMGFLSIESAYVQDITDVNAFARSIHAHGYGTTNSDYVSQLTDVVGLIKARENCPK